MEIEMNTLSAQQAFNEITKFIDENGGNYSHWYTGITSDPKTRLFREHNVTETDEGKYIYRPCISDLDARNVQETLLKLGCYGNPGGRDRSTTFVYAYLQSTQTNP